MFLFDKNVIFMIFFVINFCGVLGEKNDIFKFLWVLLLGDKIVLVYK